MRLDVCADVPLTLSGSNYTVSLKAYLDLDPCSFVFILGFESYKIVKVLLSYPWGKVLGEEMNLKKSIKLNKLYLKSACHLQQEA